MISRLNSLDWQVLRWVNLGLGRDRLDPFMRLISSWELWWAVAGLFLLIALVRRRPHELRLAMAILCAVGIADASAYQFLKPAFARPRPCFTESDLRKPATGCGSHYGFPSNHAANGMATTAVLFVAGTGPWAAASLALTLLVGLSRSYLGVHFPGDVLAGFLFGALVGGPIGMLFFPRRVFGRKAGRALWNSAKSLYG